MAEAPASAIDGISLDEVRSVAEAEAAACAEAGRLSDAVLAAIRRQRLFHLFVAADAGGYETDPVTGMRVFESIAAADGAVGWAVMIGAGAGIFSGYMQREVAREIFRDDRAVIAGSGAPTGNALKAPGGYRVRGRWSYASGARHATWFTANCVVGDDTDRPAAPRIVSIAVPASQVTIHDTWHVSAMCATGSEDISVEDAFVPQSHTFSVADDEPQVSGALYRFPFFSLAELSFASVALGIARHALDEFAALASKKKPTGGQVPLADDPDVQSRFARSEAAVSASRAFLYELANAAWQRCAAGERPGEPLQARVRLASLEAVRCSAEAVDRLYARAGMTALSTDGAFARAWRDVHAVSQNAVVSAGLYVDAGRDLLKGR